MDKAVKELHDPTPVKSTKPAASSDDDDIDSLRAQLKKTDVTIQSSLHWVTGPWCHCPPGIKEFSPEINSVLLFLSCFACRSTTHRRARGLFWFRFRTTEARAKTLQDKLVDAGRKHHSSKDPKNSDTERPPAPKKNDKTKSPAQPASTDADANA